MKKIVIDEPGFVRWEVPEGLSVVIGPNGCGKTRLCGILWGMAGNHPDGPILAPDAQREVTGDVNGHGARRLVDLHPLAADPCVIDDVDLHLSPHAIRKLLMALAESHRRCVVTTHSPVAINAVARLVGRSSVWALDARAPGGIVSAETTDLSLRYRLGWLNDDVAAQFALGDLYAAEEIAAPPRPAVQPV
jgi:energy-coupling factor transporter ATP-binding protein EcfA2